MANIDFSALLGSGVNGMASSLPPAQQQAMLQDLYQQMLSNPGSINGVKTSAAQMFGPAIADQLFQSALPQISSTPVQVTNGAGAPTTVTAGELAANPDLGTLVGPGAAAAPNNAAANPNNPLPSAPIEQPSASPLAFGNPQLDIEKILKEAETQKGLATDTLNQQNTARQKYLSDLSNLLQTQQSNQLSSELPGMYESLNSRGLLRSSALGNELGTRQSELARQTSSELAKQGLAYSDEYTSGLGGIQNSYLGARNSALQRGFSLQDFNTNVQASKELGFALQPQPQSTGKNSAPLSAGLGGAGIGAQVGGPAGAAIGGALGAGAGMINSGGK